MLLIQDKVNNTLTYTELLRNSRTRSMSIYNVLCISWHHLAYTFLLLLKWQ